MFSQALPKGMAGLRTPAAEDRPSPNALQHLCESKWIHVNQSKWVQVNPSESKPCGNYTRFGIRRSRCDKSLVSQLVSTLAHNNMLFASCHMLHSASANGPSSWFILYFLSNGFRINDRVCSLSHLFSGKSTIVFTIGLIGLGHSQLLIDFPWMFKRSNHLHCLVAWCFVILLQFALPNIQSLAFFLASASCFFKVWTVGWPYKARACDWPRAAAINPHAAELVLVARVLQVKLADHSSCIQDHARWALFEVQMYRRRCLRREGGNKTASPSQSCKCQYILFSNVFDVKK